MRVLTVLLVCLAPTPAFGVGLRLDPAGAVAAAHADLLAQPANLQPLIRYLSLYNLTEPERANAARVLSFHVNSLSREAYIVQPVSIAAGPLLRVNLSDYGWDRKTWERLAEADPYFHVQIEEVIDQPYGVMENGRFRQTEVVKEKTGKKSTALAPWLAETPAAQATLADLVNRTQSQAPVVRADWLFHQTAIQDGRKAGYYDFLGLGNTVADFDKLIGFDQKLAEQFKAEMAGVVLRSTVALNNRRLVRFGKIGGAKWLTLDAKTNVDKRNFARVLDDGFEFDATEQIASLPNGLHAFFLANAQGQRQDTAPDFIASDATAPGTDRRVHAALSCVRCHAEGIRPINDWVRRLVAPPLALQSPDYERLKRLRQLYLGDLAAAVKRDGDDYAVAVAKTNGLSLAANARAYGQFWARYAETDFDLARIELELGMPREVFLPAFREYAAKTGSLDPIIAGLLQTPPLAVRSEHWEEAFPLAQLAIKGYVQP
jgi:hypothetical protein